MYGTAGHCRAPSTHIFTLNHIPEQFSVASSQNLEETHMDTCESLHRQYLELRIKQGVARVLLEYPL